jgi:hypothetical protein
MPRFVVGVVGLMPSRCCTPGVDEGTIDLLLNWGAIIFIPVLPYVSWLQTRPNGLLIAFWQVPSTLLLSPPRETYSLPSTPFGSAHCVRAMG